MKSQLPTKEEVKNLGKKLTNPMTSQFLMASQKQFNQQKQTKLLDWELGKIKIFLLSGRIEAGKSTVAKILVNALQTEYPTAIITVAGFADGIKHVAHLVFGWDGIKDAKGRKLLQVVGTDAGRKYDNDIWVRKAYKDKIKSPIIIPNIVIFDDWRFPNEYDFWIDKPEIEKIYKIRVFRDEEIISNHESEWSLPTQGHPYYDYWFDNNGTKNQILPKVREMLEELL